MFQFAVLFGHTLLAVLLFQLKLTSIGQTKHPSRQLPHRKYKVKVNLGQEDDEDPEVSLMKLYTQIGNDEVLISFTS